MRPSIEAMIGIIRGAGLRSTRPRLAVLEVLQQADTPISHGDLVEALEGQGYDRVTLFRNLNDLAEVGLVVRTDLGDRTWRFELQRGDQTHATNHPHFTCSSCGTVTCLPERAVLLRNTGRLPRSVRAHHVEVTLRGVCDACA